MQHDPRAEAAAAGQEALQSHSASRLDGVHPLRYVSHRHRINLEAYLPGYATFDLRRLVLDDEGEDRDASRCVPQRFAPNHLSA